MVNEINREIAKAMPPEMMQIGEFILDTVFQGDSRGALSRPRHNSTVVGRMSRTQSAPHPTVQVNDWPHQATVRDAGSGRPGLS